MTSRDFCFWLQGYLELTNERELTGEQRESIRRHLALVFKHEIDPSMGDAKHQAGLNAVHSPPGTTPGIGGHGPGATLLRC
jgi:hypothetical protein